MRNYLVAAIILTALVPLPAYAQSSIEGRVGRLEGEMRAVQRKVFPGGSGQYVQPQITPPAPDSDVPGTPAGNPITDLNGRVSALESQLSGLTGDIETTQHRVKLLEDSFNDYKRTTDARLKAIEDRAASAGNGAPAPNGAAAVDTTDTTDSPAASASSMPATRPATKPATGLKVPSAVMTVKDPARAAKVAAIEKTKSDDPGEDAYLYGYRLWQAKLYPEAEAQFKSVVATYPKHKRASYAQNLLGRSYLDDDKPSLASIAFYDNYKKMPDGDRAPESLYYLSQALVKLGKPGDACKVYGELSDVYGAKISDKMKADIARGRSAAKCK